MQDSLFHPIVPIPSRSEPASSGNTERPGNGSQNDEQTQTKEDKNRAVLLNGAADPARFGPANGDQHNGDQHSDNVLDGVKPVNGRPHDGTEVDSFRKQRNFGAEEIQNQTECELRMGRNQGKEIKFVVTGRVFVATLPLAKSGYDGGKQ